MVDSSEDGGGLGGCLRATVSIMSRQNAGFVQQVSIHTDFRESRLCAQTAVPLPETSVLFDRAQVGVSGGPKRRFRIF